MHVESVHYLVRRHLWLAIGCAALFTTTRLPAMTEWDDAFYVAQLTSAVADRDLLLQDDLLAFPRPVDERLRSIATIVDSGAVHNTFSVGFAVVHGTYAWPLIALSDERIGEGLRRLLALGSLAVLVVTALSITRLCERWGFTPNVSRLASGIALASSPLALFGTRVYLNSHLLSALFAALTLSAFIRAIEGESLLDALFMGFAAGLLVINRWQDALLLLAVAPALAASISKNQAIRRPTVAALLVATAAFLSVVLLQLLAWRVQFSSWFLVPQGAGYMHWTSPALLPLLLSPYHGLLPWAPGLALGLVVAFSRSR